MSIKGIITVLVGLAWLGAIYFGYITMVKKAMRSKPSVDLSATERHQLEQREKARQARDDQKRLIEDRRTRLRDLQRR